MENKEAFEFGQVVGPFIFGGIIVVGLVANYPVTSVLVGVGFLSAFFIYRSHDKKSWKKEQARIKEQDEARRQEETYRHLVYWFKGNLGYINKSLMDKDELQEFIEAQTPPAELFTELIERLDNLEALTLGSQYCGEMEVPVKLTQDFRDRHLYVIVKSGSGKTTLLRNLIMYDMDSGAGVGIIAPEQEMLTDEVLPFIPEHRVEDVIYFNPADDNPVGFNPLYLDEGEKIDLKVDEILTVLMRVIATDSGARMQEILRQTLFALIEAQGTTIADIIPFLSRGDDSFRKQILSRVDDEATLYFFNQEYPHMPKDAHQPIITRLGQLIRARPVRNTLCVERGINFRKAMDTEKIMLFNLSDGVLGEQASQMLGQLVVSKIQMTAMSRADIAQSERRRFYLYIDEFQTFTGTSAASYEKILSRARKYRLALTLAHQQTGQIPAALLKEITGNVSTLVGFRVDSVDAMKLSREFINVDHHNEVTTIPSESFLSLQIGQAYCRINQNSFFLQTHLVRQEPNHERARRIIEHSRAKWGSTPRTEQEGSSEPLEASQANVNGLDDLEGFLTLWLTERDLDVLYSLAEYRYLDGAQIHQLHFPSQRTADKRLQLLIAAKYVRSFQAPLIKHRVLCLTPKGAELVNENFGVEASASQSTPKDYYFLRHFLGVAQFQVDIKQACEKSGVFELLGFIQDTKTAKTNEGKMVKYIQDKAGDLRHIPDGVFALRHKVMESSALCFLEVDRGTEVISKPTQGVLKCLKFYVQYFVEGGYKRYEKDFACDSFKTARVMFVTTTDRRVENIRKAANVIGNSKAKRFIWLTSQGRVNADTVLQDIWVRLDSSDASTYGFIK